MEQELQTPADGNPAPPLMKCGHRANADLVVDGERRPACAICAGISNGDNLRIDTAPPDLSERRAKCMYRSGRKVGNIHSKAGHSAEGVASTTPGLAFFEHRPDRDFDSYYCGCHGWD